MLVVGQENDHVVFVGQADFENDYSGRESQRVGQPHVRNISSHVEMEDITAV